MSLPSARLLTAVCLILNTTAARAQFYDPQKGSPMILLAGPKDGIAYFDMRKHVEQLALAAKAAEGEPLAEQLVRDYPRDGENWSLLGRFKRALNKHAEAAAAFDKAADILGRQSRPRGLSQMAVASEDLAAGNKSAALDVLRRAVFEDRINFRDLLFDFPGLASLRVDSTFRNIAGRPDTIGVSREEGWRRDLDYLYGEVLRVSPDQRPGGAPPAFTQAYQELQKDIPRLSPAEFNVRLNRMLAALHQGHTDAGSFTDRWVGRTGHLPVQFYVFPEGIFIVRALDQSLVGTRLVSIGGTPAEDALRLVNRMQSVDGDMDYLNTGAFLLRCPEYLKGSGIDIPADSVPITVELPGGHRRTVKLSGPDIQEWNTTPPVPPRVAPPMFLRNTEKNYWEQAVPEHDGLYVQFNDFANDSGETLAAFGIRLMNVLESQKPRNLILDIRYNAGGSWILSTELLRTVIAYTRNPSHRLYVLIGRETYSAAALFSNDLERLANPVFVGEASSECCNIHGTAEPVLLPYSGLRGRVTANRQNLSSNSFDGRREMSPQVPVQLTAEAYFAGLDPALDAIYTLIARDKK